MSLAPRTSRSTGAPDNIPSRRVHHSVLVCRCSSRVQTVDHRGSVGMVGIPVRVNESVALVGSEAQPLTVTPNAAS